MSSMLNLSLYVITGNRRWKHEEVAEAALKAGVEIIQYREKEAPAKIMVEEARRIRKLCDEYDSTLIVNDRVDVAIACNADGVHVGQEDMPVEIVAEIFDGIIGVSVKTVEQAKRAERHADYFGAGSVFPTGTKETEVIGLEGVKRIVEATSVPVVAIGGINRENVLEVLETGVAGVAVVSAVAMADDPEKAARELLDLIENLEKEKVREPL